MKTNNRKEATAYLSRLVEQRIDSNHEARIYWAKEVTFAPPEMPEGYIMTRQDGSDAPLHIRVDYMQILIRTAKELSQGNFLYS